VQKVLSSPGLGVRCCRQASPCAIVGGLIVRIDPLLPPEDYERLQMALKERAYSRRSNALRLLQVAYCALCASPLHATPTKPSADAERVFRYNRCEQSRKSACPANRLPAEYLEDLAARLFLGLVGNQEILEPVYIAAEDASAELAAVDETLEYLEAEYASGAVYRGRRAPSGLPA
jgi:hypothetical protein